MIKVFSNQSNCVITWETGGEGFSVEKLFNDVLSVFSYNLENRNYHGIFETTNEIFEFNRQAEILKQKEIFVDISVLDDSSCPCGCDQDCPCDCDCGCDLEEEEEEEEEEEDAKPAA